MRMHCYTYAQNLESPLIHHITKEHPMKFPNMTVTSINFPTKLLEQIDLYAAERILNRSACIRLLVQQGLKDTSITTQPT